MLTGEASYGRDQSVCLLILAVDDVCGYLDLAS